MGRNYGVKEINNWKFDKVDLPDYWRGHFGNLPDRFLMLIEGKSGHGKTEYNGQLIKLLADQLGKKVHMNNPELGKQNSFYEMWLRQDLDKIPPGSFTYGGPDKKDWDTWVTYIRNSNAKYIFLDSIDAMKVTFDMWKELTDRFKKRSFIMNCWNDPMSVESKKIKYLCDIKVKVENFRAEIRSRYGGNNPHIIYKEGYERATGKRLPNQPTLFK